MKSHFFCSFLFIMTGILCQENALNGVDIIRNGVPKASIILRENALPVERFAAEEFSKYVKKITGAELKIDSKAISGLFPIRIGEWGSNAILSTPELKDTVSKLESDGYVIDSGRNGVQITAKLTRGLLTGTYYLLQKYGGVCWFLPGEDEEYVPHSKNFIIEDKVELRNPAFTTRCVPLNFPWGTPDQILWCVRNGLATEPPPPRVKNTFELFKKLGTTYTTGESSLTNLLISQGEVKKYGSLEKARDALFAEHPEYFGLRDGKRVKTGYDVLRAKQPVSQPCTSNSEVLKRFVRNLEDAVKRKLEQAPGTELQWRLLNDDHMNWCQCENCRKLDVPDADDNSKISDRWWTLTNYLAQQVLLSGKYPNLNFRTYAYQNFRSPPKRVKPDPRISVRICPHGRCQIHAINDPECLVNATTYHKMYTEWWNRGLQTETYEYIDVLPGKSVYIPLERTWIKDLKYFYSKNLRGYVFYVHGPETPLLRNTFATSYLYKNQLKSLWQTVWMTAHFSWDIHDDFDKVWEEVNSKYYGPAWKFMREYRLLLEKSIHDSKVHMCYGSSASLTLGLCYSPGVAQKAKLLLAQAEKAAEGHPEIIGRIGRDKEYFRTNWEEASFAEKKNFERTLKIRKTEGKLVIDGKLNEKEWITGESLGKFFIPNESPSPEKRVEANPQTIVKMLYDDKNLYLGIEAEKLDGLVKDLAVKNGFDTFNGSHIEIFLANSFIKGQYYHLALTHNGKSYSALTSGPNSRDLSKTIDFEYKITDRPDAWIAEIIIPASCFGGIKEGDLWRINISRSAAVSKKGPLQSSTLSGGTFHAYEFYRIAMIGETEPVLLNPGFEDMESAIPSNGKKLDWVFKGDKKPRHWHFTENTPGIAEVVSDKTASEGKTYLRVSIGKSSPHFRQTLRRSGSDVKKYSVSMKVRGNTILTLYLFQENRWKGLDSKQFRINNKDEWKTISCVMESSAEGRKDLDILVNNGYLEVDDVKVTPIEKEEMPDALKH